MATNLAETWDDHTRQEFETRDPRAALRTMTAAPTVTHIPVMTGGTGAAEVERFYERHFIGQSPADFSLQPVSRTVGETSLVDEFICRFTHDIVMDWMLPGVPPSGRAVALPVVAVIVFEDGLIAHERVYWDQAALLVQIGLLDPAGLPVTGAEAAHRVVDGGVASNDLIRRAARSR